MKNIFNSIVTAYLLIWFYIIVAILTGYSEFEPNFEGEVSSISAKYGYVYGAKMNNTFAIFSLLHMIIGSLSTISMLFRKKYSDYGFIVSFLFGYILLFFDSDNISILSDIDYLFESAISTIEGVIISIIVFKRDMIFGVRKT